MIPDLLTGLAVIIGLFVIAWPLAGAGERLLEQARRDLELDREATR